VSLFHKRNIAPLPLLSGMCLQLCMYLQKGATEAYMSPLVLTLFFTRTDNSSAAPGRCRDAYYSVGKTPAELGGEKWREHNAFNIYWSLNMNGNFL